jgi:hypothetical protein
MAPAWRLPRTRTRRQRPHQQTTADALYNALMQRLIHVAGPPAHGRHRRTLRDHRHVMSIWRSKVM